MESSLQDISSNSSLWKQNDSLVIVQMWSWRSKHAASARAGLQEANTKLLHFIFPYEFVLSSLYQIAKESQNEVCAQLRDLQEDYGCTVSTSD